MGKASDSGKARTPECHLQWQRHAVFATVCLLVIGLFAWSAEPGFSELKNPQAKDSYYNLLVQGFRAGQLNLKQDAPPALARLADPYDPALNGPYIGDVSDMSYYKGKLYLYFGVTPVLVLLWPYATLTGRYLSDKDAVVTFYGVGFLAAACLLYAIWRRYFPESRFWAPVVGVLALGLAAGTLDVSLWCDVYEVAISCGFAFVMLALTAMWRAFHEPEQKAFPLLLASLAYGLAIGSRPSLLFGAVVLLIPVAHAYHGATEPSGRRRVGWLLAAATGPLMLIGLGLMLYNKYRFDSPLEFGWHYQLGGGYQPDTAQQFSLHYLWFNFRFYFFEWMRWSPHFPFLQTVLPPPLPAGYFGVGKSYGGILLVYFPLAWLALAAPLVWKGRPAAEVSVLRCFVTVVFVLFILCALTICLFLSASSRYGLDFLPPLMLLAVMGIFGLERTLVNESVWRRIARSGWRLLLAYTVVVNLLVTIEAHAEANYFAGNFLVRQARPDEALGHFNTALSLEPDSAAFHAGLGTAYYRKKQLDQAISEFQKAFEIAPDFADVAEAHNDLGYSLLQKGRVNEAIPHFQKTLEIEPNFAETHNTLGDCLLQTGQMDAALTEYQKAVEIKPDFVDAQNNLGFALFRTGQVPEAIAHFQKALEIQPNFAEAHYNLGCSFFQAGKVDEAIAQFQKAVELQPHLFQAYNDLGNAYRRKGMAAEALASYQRVTDLEPRFISAQINLAWMLATWPDQSVRNGTQAVALAEKANQLSNAQDSRILRTLAAAYAETGRFSEAETMAKQALAMAEARANQRLINALQTEIGLYHTNTPCRSTDE
jgi:tetratricopeptide (TPR) repeat protein